MTKKKLLKDYERCDVYIYKYLINKQNVDEKKKIFCFYMRKLKIWNL
jgi:hypothetical protein